MAKRRRGPYTFPIAETKEGELIKRRRLQMLIHSCAYYEFDTEFISDDKWQEWANELADSMKKHPDAYSDRFDQWFDGWDGTTGYHLPHRDPWVHGTLQFYIDNNILS